MSGRIDGLPAPLRKIVQPPLDAVRRALKLVRSIAGRLRPRRLVATKDYFGALLAESRARRDRQGFSVAVDATPLWGSVTGVGWYLHSLLLSLANEPDLDLRLYGPLGESPSVEPPAGPALEWVEFPVPDDLTLPPGILRRILRYLVPVLMGREQPDVVFAPNFFLPRRFQLMKAPRVVMVHDLASVHHGWTLEEATARALKRELELSIREARFVLTPSTTVGQELVDGGLAGADKVVAVHHGPGHLAAEGAPDGLGEFLDSMGLDSPYVLTVGTLEPRKNLKVLLDAWKLGRERGESLPRLVLCGARGWKDDALRTEVEAGLRQGWLLVPGYVSDEDLERLYFGASAVVQASLYEGFGLPLVEAMVAGRPLVCSDIPVFREVVGGAALLVPAEDPEAWLDGVLAALEPARSADLTAQGLVRVRDFDWRTCALATLSVLRSAAK